MSDRTLQDTVLPLRTPIKSRDGKRDIHEIALKRNSFIFANLVAVNRDPEMWGEDAEEWKPERWLGKKPEDVAKVRIPGIYPGL
jgi:cytochrome P450